MHPILLRLPLLGLLVAQTALAHEAWILPWNFQQDKVALTRAHLQVGTDFNGSSQLYNPDRFERLDIVRNGEPTPIKGRVGDLPAIRHTLAEPGLHVLVHQSTGNIISYPEWEKFRNFTDKEGVSWAQDEHRKRGHPEAGFDETFVRYSKSLITWQHPEGSDSFTGMPFEVVATNNPYLDRERIDIRVMWQGEPYRDAQVSVFAKRPDKPAVRTDFMTNDRGELSISLELGSRYLINSVAMEPLDNGPKSPLWRSHWASMTLMIPSDR